MGIFEERLEEAGFDRAMFDLDQALTNLAKLFGKAGGTKEQFLAACSAVAERMLGEGQRFGVREDHPSSAAAQLPMPEGHGPGVREDQGTSADGHAIASGEANHDLSERTNSGVPPARDSVSPI